MAQSIFQVGGNFGFSLGPLLAAFVVVGKNQRSIAWFSIDALLAMVLLFVIGSWYRRTAFPRMKLQAATSALRSPLPPSKVVVLAGYSAHAHLFQVRLHVEHHQLLHVLPDQQIPPAGAERADSSVHLPCSRQPPGSLIGGPVGDRIGRKYVIWGSIIGVLPFTLLLPYANLFWTGILTVLDRLDTVFGIFGDLVFAQELIPGKVGMISGLFFGFAFGVAGVAAAMLGKLADRTSIDFVYRMCAFMPAIGVLAYFLPNLEPGKLRRKNAFPEQVYPEAD